MSILDQWDPEVAAIVHREEERHRQGIELIASENYASAPEANRAAYAALMEPGDVAMGMDLSQGGHLTHGFNVNFSGKLYRFIHYGVDRETELLDCDEIARLAREHRPRVIVVGATAYPRIIDFACY